jgi:hypothetical protein
LIFSFLPRPWTLWPRLLIGNVCQQWWHKHGTLHTASQNAVTPCQVWWPGWPGALNIITLCTTSLRRCGHVLFRCSRTSIQNLGLAPTTWKINLAESYEVEAQANQPTPLLCSVYNTPTTHLLFSLSSQTGIENTSSYAETIFATFSPLKDVGRELSSGKGFKTFTVWKLVHTNLLPCMFTDNLTSFGKVSYWRILFLHHRHHNGPSPKTVNAVYGNNQRFCSDSLRNTYIHRG